MLQPNNTDQIQRNIQEGERRPLLRDNVVIVIPQSLMDALEQQGCCTSIHGKRAINAAKLGVYGFKRFLQDLSISYAGYSIATNLDANLQSPYAYIPVFGLAVLTTAEDVLFEASKQHASVPALRESKHGAVRIVKHSIDAGFAAGVYLSGFQSDDQRYTIATTSVGLALIGSKMTLGLLHQSQREFTQNHRFKTAKNVFDIVGSYCAAAGVAQFCTEFLQAVVFDGRQFATSDTTNRYIQNAVGLMAALITTAAKLKHSHKAEDILESLTEGIIYMMMGTIFSYDIYTSAEPNSNSIPDSYGYTMLAFFMVTMLAFYGRDIYQTVKRPVYVLNEEDFSLVDADVAAEAVPAANAELPANAELAAQDEQDVQDMQEVQQQAANDAVADRPNQQTQHSASNAAVPSVVPSNAANPSVTASNATIAPPASATSRELAREQQPKPAAVPATATTRPTQASYVHQHEGAGTLFSMSKKAKVLPQAPSSQSTSQNNPDAPHTAANSPIRRKSS